MNSPEASPLPRGEALHRRSRRWAFAALVFALPCIAFIKPLWYQLITLGSGAFMLAAGLWGLVLAAGPVLMLVAALCALFLRVEAACAPRARRRPAGDALAIALALLLSFAPALAALYPPVHALLTGLIGFRGAAQQYPLADDPYGFWQAVVFWLMGAATLGFLAGAYWRAKWRQRRALTSPEGCA